MSNRRRREWIWHARSDQLLSAGLTSAFEQQLDALPVRVGDTIGAMRLAFGRVSRRPLKSFSSSKGGGSFDEGLRKLQGQNTPADFDLLRGDLYEVLAKVESCRLWSDYQDDLESVCSVFEQSREILAPLRRVNLLARDELQWAAVVHRAAKSLPCRSALIFQCASSLSSVLDLTRDHWMELESKIKWKWRLERLADHEVYALLAMDEAYEAANSLVGLIQRFDQWADNKKVSRDTDGYEAFRGEVSSWERTEFRYAISQLDQAKDLLHLAHLAHVGADSAKAGECIKGLEMEVSRRAAALAAAEPLVEAGKRFVENRHKGGDTLRGRKISVFKHAIEELFTKVKSDVSEDVSVAGKIFEELRRDCSDDEDVSGTSQSELMNDLRERPMDPIKVRIQEVPDGISDPKSVIRFRDLKKGIDDDITVGAFNNYVSSAKSAALKAAEENSK